MRFLAAATAAIAFVTLTVPAHVLASTQHGALWRLFTSIAVADRPMWASILGFTIVGVATIRVAGGRIALAAALLGHVLSALVVYGALDAAHRAVTTLDYGTSAVIAAWIGVLASRLWSRSHAAAVALVVGSALIGWFCKGTLTVLDWEHAVALGVGTTIDAWVWASTSLITRLRSNTKRESTASSRA